MCFREVSKVFQVCLEEVLRVLQGRLRGVPRDLKGNSMELQGYLKEIQRVFRRFKQA